MAKEIREIIAFQEQLVNGDPAKLARLDDLRNAVNCAEMKGALAKGLPKAIRIRAWVVVPR